MKREENSCKGSDQKDCGLSYPFSLLKNELIVPFPIVNESIIDMPNGNGISSGFFSKSGKEKEAEREVGEDYLCLYLEKKNYLSPRCVNGQRK